MNEGPANDGTWFSRRLTSVRRYLSPHPTHDRLPNEDDASLMESAHLIPPNNIPMVPPSTPVSTAPGYSSDSPDGRTSPVEAASFLPDNQVGTSSGAPQGSEAPTLVRPASFQRIVQALGSFRNAGRGSSDADDENGFASRVAQGSGSLLHSHSREGMSRTSSGLPVCLICLEPLTPEDFENGDAMSLECECKGDMALRHKSCALKWVNVKGDLICDICHTPIGNLPAPPPRSDNGEEGGDDASSGRFVGAADVFDCIRMTWVVTIVCILFFELDITRALFTGMVVAVLYTFSCQIMRCLYTRSEDTNAPPRVIPHNPNLINAAPIII